jgi:CRP-like cAMP-binding protein
MKKLEIDKALAKGEIRDVRMFQGLADEELREIADSGEYRLYASGEAVIAQGTIDPWVYVIIEGRVEVQVKGDAGVPVVVGHLSGGDVFGETAIFTDIPRSASVIPETEVTILALSRDEFSRVINKYPRAGLKVFGFIIYGLLNKLQGSNRGLVMEKECNVTAGDIDSLMRLVPSTLGDLLDGH